MKKINFIKNNIIKISIFAFVILSAQITYAVGYTPLEPDAFGSGVVTAASSNLTSFLSAVFTFSIAIAVGLALIEIIWGGIIKMTTDSWSGKSEANNKIVNAAYGLALVLVSWLVLYTINPTLVSFSGNTFLNPPKEGSIKNTRAASTGDYFKKTPTYNPGATSTLVQSKIDSLNEFVAEVNTIVNPLGAVTGRTSCGSGAYACVEVIFDLPSDASSQEKLRSIATALIQNRFEVDIRVPTGTRGNYYGINSGGGSTIEDANLTAPLLQARRLR